MEKNYKNLSWDDIKAMYAEIAERQKETDRQMKENDRKMAESKAEFDRAMKESNAEINKILKELSRNIGGISNSNGEMAEEYFYNSFKADTTFANEKFDMVEKNSKRSRGELEAEFDLILLNGKSAAVIEVKYNAKPDNIRIDKLIERVDIFKKLYPEYKNHNIYLGVAAMSFKSGLETKLHNAGIATIKQIGKKMVVFDKDVKAF